MELPPQLRHAVDRVLSGAKLAEVAAAAAALSQRYREPRRDGRSHVGSERDALAYLAVRLPATFAAIRASFAAIVEARPDFAPKTALDIGAGPGTALWAAADCWPGLAEALLVEASPIFRACGEELAAGAVLPRVTWRVADVAVGAIDYAPSDLVILAYTLNELAPGVRQSVMQQLWRATADTLVIVEPGTPSGWQRHPCRAPSTDRERRSCDRAVSARRCLSIAAAGLVPFRRARRPLTPSPPGQGRDGPLGGREVSYIAVSRKPASTPQRRASSRDPDRASGRVTLKLCRPDGSAGEQLFSRRDGALFKRASRSYWGSSL